MANMQNLIVEIGLTQDGGIAMMSRVTALEGNRLASLQIPGKHSRHAQP